MYCRGVRSRIADGRTRGTAGPFRAGQLPGPWTLSYHGPGTATPGCPRGLPANHGDAERPPEHSHRIRRQLPHSGGGPPSAPAPVIPVCLPLLGGSPPAGGVSAARDSRASRRRVSATWLSGLGALPVRPGWRCCRARISGAPERCVIFFLRISIDTTYVRAIIDGDRDRRKGAQQWARIHRVPPERDAEAVRPSMRSQNLSAAPSRPSRLSRGSRATRQP